MGERRERERFYISCEIESSLAWSLPKLPPPPPPRLFGGVRFIGVLTGLAARRLDTGRLWRLLLETLLLVLAVRGGLARGEASRRL